MNRIIEMMRPGRTPHIGPDLDGGEQEAITRHAYVGWWAGRTVLGFLFLVMTLPR